MCIRDSLRLAHNCERRYHRDIFVVQVAIGFRRYSPHRSPRFCDRRIGLFRCLRDRHLGLYPGTDRAGHSTTRNEHHLRTPDWGFLPERTAGSDESSLDDDDFVGRRFATFVQALN